MKLSRRKLFEAALGVGQVALLSRYGLLPSSARAQSMSFKPTKLLAIWLDGGLHWESFFSPFTSAGITKFMPAPGGGLIPWGYSPSQVENFDRSPVDLDAPGTRRKWRGPVYWNWNSPGDTMGAVPNSGGAQQFRPYGYAWANPAYKLYDRAALLIGADQGTASHYSGIVASMCGVAGANFRAPSVQAVVAAAMAKRFPDRPIPNVSLGGPSPTALDLPSLAAPTRVTNDASVEPTLSDKRDGAWLNLRTRTDRPELAFDGTPTGATAPLTATDQYTLDQIRARKGKSTAGTDALLGSLYDTYKGASRTIARDIMGTLANVRGFEKLSVADMMYPANWTACIGYADTCGGGSSLANYDFALKLLKSELVSSVSLRATSIANFSFDTHSSNGPQYHANHLRIALEGIGRVLMEMSLTPSATNAGKTLLDETLVYIYSDFGRTFPKTGSDHHPATCAILAGGSIIGNQMVGGYDESMNGSPMGVPVPLVEESGMQVTRTPKSQDIVATVLHAFGLEGGTDYFIPGGYGYYDGVVG
ncbi:MAG: DUF1501 domain-containing protein [Myxococcaceae bacterium]